MKILIITSRLPPCPPIKGDQVVAYHRLRILSRQHKITLLSFYENPEELKHLSHLKKFCESIHVVQRSKLESLAHIVLGIFGNTPLQVLLYQSAQFQRKLSELLHNHQYDLVHGFLLRLAPYLELVKIRKIPVLLEIIDSMQLNLERTMLQGRGWKVLLWREELRRIKKYEPRVVRALKPVTVVAQGDRDFIGEPSIQALPLGVDTETFYPDPDNHAITYSLIFSGNMSYPPNIRAAIWFAQQCFPSIKAQLPDVVFTIVGSSPTTEIRELEKLPGVKVLGFVDSMPRALASAQVCVAPMQSGSGMQFKILEAMACARPVVTTTLGLGSIKAQPGRDLLVADSPEEFSEQVITLLKDSEQSARIGNQARQFVEEHHSWVHSAEQIEELYTKIIAQRAKV